MKKIKWILLIIGIFLVIVLIFGSCKKTKAYSYNLSNPLMDESYQFNAQGQSGFVYLFENNLSSFDILQLRVNNSNCYILYAYGSDLYLYDSALARNVNYMHLDNYDYIYIQFTFDYVNNNIFLYVTQVDATLTNNQISSWHLINNYGEVYQWPLTNSTFKNNYLSAQPTTNVHLLPNNNYGSNGLIQFYLFDIDSMFSDQVDEQVEFLFNDIKRDISLRYINSLLTTAYNSGYSTGYQTGWDEGYSDGYSAGDTAGYNRGYSAGEDAGYQTGWDEGYSDGYSAGDTAGFNRGYSAGDTAGFNRGYDSGYTTGYQNGYVDGQNNENVQEAIHQAYERGYDEGVQDGYMSGRIAGLTQGYNEGYSDGVQDGMSGATPMSQATTLIGSLFTGIGSILSIQLFPGFPIGLLILVPLFFSVLGLVLWIWRRN